MADYERYRSKLSSQSVYQQRSPPRSVNINEGWATPAAATPGHRHQTPSYTTSYCHPPSSSPPLASSSIKSNMIHRREIDMTSVQTNDFNSPSYHYHPTQLHRVPSKVPSAKLQQYRWNRNDSAGKSIGTVGSSSMNNGDDISAGVSNRFLPTSSGIPSTPSNLNAFSLSSSRLSDNTRRNDHIGVTAASSFPQKSMDINYYHEPQVTQMDNKSVHQAMLNSEARLVRLERELERINSSSGNYDSRGKIKTTSEAGVPSSHLVGAEAEIARLRQELSEKDGDLENYRTTVQKQRASILSLCSAQREGHNSNDETTQLQRELARIKSCLAEAEIARDASIRRAERLESKITGTLYDSKNQGTTQDEHEKRELLELRNRTFELQTLTQQQEADINRMNKERGEIEAEFTQLKEEVDHFRSVQTVEQEYQRINNVDGDDASSRIVELKEEIEGLQTHVNTLVGELNDARVSNSEMAYTNNGSHESSGLRSDSHTLALLKECYEGLSSLAALAIAHRDGKDPDISVLLGSSSLWGDELKNTEANLENLVALRDAIDHLRNEAVDNAAEQIGTCTTQ